MSGPGGDAQRYFRAIEETFIRLRGAPLLLSPEDWRQAEEWQQRGIPLELVLSVIEDVFVRRAERGAAGRIQSLRYCAPAVETAWEEVSSLTSAGHRRTPAALDVRARLESLAAALPAAMPGRDDLAARIRGLGGSSDEVEAALAALDREMIAAALESLGEEERRPLARRTAAALAGLAERIEEGELADARDRLLRQALRRARGLPVLSLFSPEARGAD